MDMGGNKPVRLRDPLADQHRISFFHQGLGGPADMLAQGINHFPRRVEQTQRHIAAQILMILRMHTAAERIFHLDDDSFPRDQVTSSFISY